MTSQEHRNAVDLALKRYDVIFKYLAYENTVYWTRSQLLLVANAGLLALRASKLPTNPRDKDVVAALVTSIPIVVVGFALSVLWLLLLRRAEVWIARWEGLCRNLEASAFGYRDVLRNPPETKIKALAHRLAWLFLILWLVGGSWLLLLTVQLSS